MPEVMKEIKHVKLEDEGGGHGGDKDEAAGPAEPSAAKHDPFHDFTLEHQINLQHDVEHQIEILCVKKAALPAWKIGFLGTLSGFWMALSGCFAFSAAGGVEENLLRYFPVMQKLILALFAPVAMHFIVVFGGEFYSGNCMFMSVGFLKNRITAVTLLYNWASCFFWNAVGCILGVWVFAYLTDLFAEDPAYSYIIKVSEAKVRMDPWIVFLRAIPANFLICLAIQMGISARDMLGKVIALHIPLTVYTMAGFEHAIGNLVIVPLGMMYGADIGIGQFLANNLIPAAIGNAIGGCMIGYIETLLFSWDQGAGNTNQMHNHTDYKKRQLPQIQVPLVHQATQKAIGKTQEELQATLAAIQSAKEELAKYEAEAAGHDSPMAAAIQAAVSVGVTPPTSEAGSRHTSFRSAMKGALDRGSESPYG
mmetsp:Transcript_16093/g.39163  ORF Transcript_16093/g.39163 Transcript_16093/m.39163 type:complete len:422 (+) Transcript_16093:140-1405(+)